MSKLKADQVIMGPEPVFSGPISRIELATALNWYNYFYTIRDTRKWIEEYLSKQAEWPMSEIKSVINSNKITQTIASLCRLAMNGAELDFDLTERLAEYKNTKSRRATATSNIPKEIPIIADLDEILDQFSIKYKIIDIPTLEYKPTEMEVGKQHINELLNEISLIGKDEQVTEAYSRLTKPKIKAYRTFLEQLIVRLDVEKPKIVRKPRKKKVKSPLVIVKNVKYQEKCKDLKLSSIEPKKIVGAKELWVYNTKYKKVARIVSLAGGLTVKGTTIQNMDDSKSFQKTLRKPKDVLPLIVTDGKVAVRKLVDGLSTKPQEFTGRLNEHTLLLRSF